MLDKGFEEDIKRIINTTPTQGLRQTLMFTATWPQSVRELAATFMTSPVKISIGDNPTGELRANNRITQNVEVVDPRGRRPGSFSSSNNTRAATKRMIVFWSLSVQEGGNTSRELPQNEGLRGGHSW
jgi:superfamily II DNA/RNA helicase